MQSASTLALASTVFGSLSFYFYLKSLTYDLSADISDIFLLLRAKKNIDNKQSSDWRGLADTWEETAKNNKNKTAIIYVNDNVSYTFAEVNAKANQVAHWAVSVGLKEGDVVALLMDSRPEFVFTVLGLCKIGCTISLINHNLAGKPLIHSLSVCKANHFIIGSEHADKVIAVKQAFEEIVPGAQWYSYGGSASGMHHVDPILQQQSIKRPNRDLRKNTNSASNLFYIYTSGTTGHPKASMIKHIRFFTAAMVFSESYRVKSTDINYCCLPLYHSAGGIVGLGMMIYTGGTMVLRKKFSSSSFWPDIVKHKCTVFQYIGELCRYLVAQPPTEFDRAHSIRICIGNGMRPDVWKKFQERFNVPQIGEFYGATEGNATLANTRNRYPAIGYISPLLTRLFPIKIVKFDVKTEELIRDKNGLCIECQPEEVGELLGFIDDNDVLRKFDGYTDESATKKKIASDVFKKGDKWFRSGDLLKKDKDGFFYFVDRIGDTFRWKGENVATGEVAEVITTFPGVLEVNVYGVSIPGQDGRAGMACVVLDNSFDFNQFYTYISANLPIYAQPIFLRVQPQIEITSTFKHVKGDLQKEGFDPSTIKDKLYFRDDGEKKFVPLDENLYNQIQNGTQKSRL